MDIGAPGRRDALPARCRFRPCPEHPSWVGVLGRGQRHPPQKHPQDSPSTQPPVCPHCLEPSIPYTDGQNSWATVPKSPQHPDPGCWVPPAVSRAPQHLCWLDTTKGPDPSKVPWPSQRPRGLHKPRCQHLSGTNSGAPRASQPPQRRLSAPGRHTKKRRERRKMDARSTPALPTQKPL